MDGEDPSMYDANEPSLDVSHAEDSDVASNAGVEGTDGGDTDFAHDDTFFENQEYKDDDDDSRKLQLYDDEPESEPEHEEEEPLDLQSAKFGASSGNDEASATANANLAAKLANPHKTRASYMNMGADVEDFDDEFGDEDEDDYDEDDFDVSTQEPENDVEKYLQSSQAAIPNSDLEAAKRERAALLKVHAQRQRDIMLLWHIYDGAGADDRKQQLLHLAEAKSCTLHNFEYLQHLYATSLDTLSTLWTLSSQTKEVGDKRIAALTKVLDKKDAKLTRLQNAYQTYIREVGMGAAQALGTGKNAALKHIRNLESTEEAIDTELQQTRLKYLHSKGQVDLLESNLKRNNGTSDTENDYIDREQCLTELSTLGEALEERTANLHKLHRKLSTLVQVHNHVKEKLFFVGEQNTTLQKELDQLNDEANALRVQLSESKKNRDKYKRENALLKQQQGFVRSDALVADFEKKRVELTALSKELQQYKNEYARLMDLVEAHKRERPASTGQSGSGTTMAANARSVRGGSAGPNRNKPPMGGGGGGMALSGAGVRGVR